MCHNSSKGISVAMGGGGGEEEGRRRGGGWGGGEDGEGGRMGREEGRRGGTSLSFTIAQLKAAYHPILSVRALFVMHSMILTAVTYLTEVEAS